MNKTYLTKVVYDNDDLVIVFPEELLKELHLIENEYLSWEIAPDNQSVTIRKVKFVDNTTQE